MSFTFTLPCLCKKACIWAGMKKQICINLCLIDVFQRTEPMYGAGALLIHFSTWLEATGVMVTVVQSRGNVTEPEWCFLVHIRVQQSLKISQPRRRKRRLQLLSIQVLQKVDKELHDCAVKHMHNFPPVLLKQLLYILPTLTHMIS